MSSTTSELKNTILRAGAGAGKTTTLTALFLDFASDFKSKHQRFPRIVVTTFTRKATQELKERLSAKALEKKREDLFHFANSRSQVQISTIHGVLSLFLSRYGSAIGLTPDYKIMSDSEIRRGARKIMRKHILENPSLQELLEEYEFSVIENALMQYFSERIVFPQARFITLDEQESATRKVIKDISGRFKRLCVEIDQETENEKWKEYVATLHSFNWDAEDLGQFFGLLQGMWDGITKPSYLKKNPPFSGSLNEELEELRDRIDKLLESARYRPDFWARHQKNCELFEQLAQLFCGDLMQQKLENGLLSMADLETFAYKIIKDSPESAENFSQEWDFWMVDEYQDTSPIQVEILRNLIGAKPYFVVGDPQQSIYLFRGARSEVFQEKVAEVQSQDGEVQVKLVNYRSTPEVLEFFNHYFTKLDGKQFAAMTPAPDKERKGPADPVVQVLVTETTDEDEISREYLGTVARIQELLKEGVSPEQICILSRTHKVLADIAKVAQDHGVPLQLHSGSGFYERREVIDALAILKFLVNPHDNANLVALLRSPWLVMADSDILEFCHSFKHSFWREALKTLENRSSAHPLAILKSLLEMSEEKGLSFTLKTALIDLGLFDYSARIDSTGRREANLWKVVYLLSTEERRPGFNFLDFLDSSLDSLSTDEGGEDSDATPVIEPKRVNFMTVHASKGLQFDHVILPGMGKDPRASHAPVISFAEKSGQWTLKIRDEETQMLASSILADQIMEELRRREGEEFLRVLYVALTRAKEGVTLQWDLKKVGKKSWATQCPLNIEEGLHEEKDFSYVVRRENPQPVTLADQELEVKQLRTPWAPIRKEEKRKHISVTALVTPESAEGSSHVMSVAQLAPGLARAQQGTTAHRLFEALKFTSYQDLLKIPEYVDLRNPLVFLAETEQLPLLRIIENGYVEWGFALVEQNALMQGQIDLWGIVDDTLWLVDYKTGSQRYSETAFKQLEAYAWALYRMNYLDNVKTVKLAVVYPMDEIVKIKEILSLMELNNRMKSQIADYIKT
ncbi:UvrD-helicase domain-containing protein [Bdellovibrio sp. HCB288]|uniref:UvrD-helicase domain-containing protein n=1 Tax=Bdellovibrio sp. HCB288 TaxID=3394355 RepID=UPI0039B5C0D9